MSGPVDDVVWYKDGHRLYLQLNRSELSVLATICPQGDDRECRVGKFDCIVEWFVGRYGLECNVGVSEVSSEMEIAWSVQGDTDDADLCQVWIIPVADEAFAAWLGTQQGEGSGSE